MTDQTLLRSNVSDEPEKAVYANRVALGKLAELTRTNPDATSVMLTLMAKMEASGVVRVTQATVAKLCNYTLQQVEKALVDLADAGWINSVDASTEPGGPLVCVVNPDLARMERPDEQM